jgi:hypothetical protein
MHIVEMLLEVVLAEERARLLRLSLASIVAMLSKMFLARTILEAKRTLSEW